MYYRPLLHTHFIHFRSGRGASFPLDRLFHTKKALGREETLTCSHHNDNFLHAATPPHAHFNKSGSDVLGLAFRHRCAAALLAFVNTSRIRLVGCLVDGALASGGEEEEARGAGSETVGLNKITLIQKQ